MNGLMIDSDDTMLKFFKVEHRESYTYEDYG
jgi:hypothetical protein